MFASLPKSFSIKKSAVLLAISEEVVTKAREMLHCYSMHFRERVVIIRSGWQEEDHLMDFCYVVAFGLVNGIALFTTKIKVIILCK